MTKNKYCVYTALTGNYDALLKIKCTNENYDYICFTDAPDLIQRKKVGIWNIWKLEYNQLDSARNSRWPKILGYKLLNNYEASIYIDANVNILTSYIYDLVNTSNQNLLIPRHSNRGCIYDEIEICRDLGLDNEDILLKVQQELVAHNMPSNYGLNDASLIYRKHHVPQIDQIMDSWWNYVEHFSKRDQVSLSYVLWSYGIKIDDIAIPNIRKHNKNFAVYPHLERLGLLYPLVFLVLAITRSYNPQELLPTLHLLHHLAVSTKKWAVALWTSLGTLYSIFLTIINK